ncbi:MAG: ABC transporter permease [Treponemataceae bacterium]
MITSKSAVQTKIGAFKYFDPSLLSGGGRLFALILICVIMSMLSPVFFSARNLSNIITNACIMTILGVGLTITIITCGPDLSVGSILTITSVIAAIMLKAGIFFGWAILAALALGILLGLLNGLMISKIGIPSFISTYGLQWAVFGFAYVILKGYVVYDFDPAFRFVGNGYLFDVIPMPIIVMLGVVIVGFIILKKTTLGRTFYAVGANKEAAKMSGINVEKTMIYAFIICGLLSAVGGIVLVARINACQADIGKNYLLPTIATVYMGGTRAAGGQGGVIGTLIGALIMTVVENGMNLMGVPSVWRGAIIGALIIITVLVNQWLNKKLEAAGA